MYELVQEMEMLSHAISIPVEERKKPLPPPPADLIGKLHLAATNLGKERQQVASDVFRPSHRLPTTSLAQQVAELPLLLSLDKTCSRLEECWTLTSLTWRKLLVKTSVSIGWIILEVLGSICFVSANFPFSFCGILCQHNCMMQANIEIAQAQEQAQRQEKAAKVRKMLEADEEYMLQKQRNWDNWKDDHERGSGNDKLRPTA